jgi:hypothetical protein
MKKIISIMLLIASLQAFGQEKKIRGQVIHGKDSLALAFAKIELIHYINKDNWQVTDSTRTDLKGVYYLKAGALQTGQYIIRINEKASFRINLPTTGNQAEVDLPRFYYGKE